MSVYYKPQSPIQSGEDFIYPITTADQIMKSDNSRLEQNGEIVADNSPKLGGIAASEYALKTKTVPTSRTVNGKALSENITLSASEVGARPDTWMPSASDVGALPSGGTAVNASKLGGKSLADIMLMMYPVGAIYISTNETSPASLFGGSWERIYERFLLAANSVYTAGSTGGEAKHTLTISEIPSHTHRIKEATSSGESTGYRFSATTGPYSMASYLETVGEGGSHNNMPPYLAVYMWKRVS